MTTPVSPASGSSVAPKPSASVTQYTGAASANGLSGAAALVAGVAALCFMI